MKEYVVTLAITSTVRVTVPADSAKEAEKMAIDEASVMPPVTDVLETLRIEDAETGAEIAR